MNSFRYASAAASQWHVVADSCAAQLAPPNPKYNLGFLYVTDRLVDEAVRVLDVLRERTGVEHWVGTVGTGICATGVEFHDKPAAVVLLGCFPRASFRVFSSTDSGFEDFEAQHEAWSHNLHSHFGVVHGDPYNQAITHLIERVAKGGFLVGGLSSSRADHFQLADEFAKGGLSGVLFSESVGVVTRLSQGCSPVGPRHEITHCRANLLIELDGRPALEVLADDIGEATKKMSAAIEGNVYAGFPLPRSDTGDYVVRNIVGLDPAKKLIAVSENVEATPSVMFCRRDRESAYDDMVRMLKELKRRLISRPKGALYYSCVARGPNLFGSDSEELKLIDKILGPVPLAGFYGNGEISHDRLYGYTGVLTLFT